MTRSKSSQETKNQKVIFSVEAPQAKEVFLAGDFSNWNPKAHPMKKNANGEWKKVLMLSPKTYEYKFLIDGEWKDDPRNDQRCLNSFGTINNILNLC